MSHPPNTKKSDKTTNTINEQELLEVLSRLHTTLELIAVSVRVSDDMTNEKVKMTNKLLLYKIISVVFAVFFGIPCILFILYVILSLLTELV